MWELYAPPDLGGDDRLGYRRSIAAANDGGRWVFEQGGEPFPFEIPDAYEAPRKRDRFTRPMLQAYLDQFSLRPFDDDFYLVDRDHPAVLLERPNYTHAQEPPEFSLEEVESGLPWKR